MKIGYPRDGGQTDILKILLYRHAYTGGNEFFKVQFVLREHLTRGQFIFFEKISFNPSHWWWIQDSLEGAVSTPNEVPNYYLTNFS